MDIHQFLKLFVGRWRSQRSDHQFSKGNGGDARSVIDFTALNLDDPDLVAICQKYGVNPNTMIHPMKMSWEEESLSSNKPKGQALIVAVPDDLNSSQKGLVLTKQGKSIYELGVDEALTIKTITAQNVIEERIWYGNPNLRFRVVTLFDGDVVSDRHVQSSKFYSEIRTTALTT
jgi:phycoerythrin-associated linker protein